MTMNGVTFSVKYAYGPNELSTSFFQSIISNKKKDPFPSILIGYLNAGLDGLTNQYPNSKVLGELFVRFKFVVILKRYYPKEKYPNKETNNLLRLTWR
uniref:Uncharacterized protein n=1 Tax=Lepeophtheirus salmonis TaxID=72036 RepID=A0A0K2VBM3_LEPSM